MQLCEKEKENHNSTQWWSPRSPSRLQYVRLSICINHRICYNMEFTPHVGSFFLFYPPLSPPAVTWMSELIALYNAKNTTFLHNLWWKLHSLSESTRPHWLCSQVLSHHLPHTLPSSCSVIQAFFTGAVLPFMTRHYPIPITNIFVFT